MSIFSHFGPPLCCSANAIYLHPSSFAIYFVTPLINFSIDSCKYASIVLAGIAVTPKSKALRTDFLVWLQSSLQKLPIANTFDHSFHILYLRHFSRALISAGNDFSLLFQLVFWPALCQKKSYWFHQLHSLSKTNTRISSSQLRSMESPYRQGTTCAKYYYRFLRSFAFGSIVSGENVLLSRP